VTTKESPESVRLDKWLWAARFFKTRTLSQDNIDLGRIRMNGQKLKPSKEIRAGDELEILRGQDRFVVIVRALAEKRGSAAQAQELYEETAEGRAERERIADNRRLMPMPGADVRGRPTKREGRKLREFIDAEFSYDPGKDLL
jgi:ribosome-associated heat shock protein Hsp15